MMQNRKDINAVLRSDKFVEWLDNAIIKKLSPAKVQKGLPVGWRLSFINHSQMEFSVYVAGETIFGYVQRHRPCWRFVYV